MTTFFSTCAAGVEGLASEMAAEDISGYRCQRVFPGALLYTAEERLPSLAVFQNTFVVLASYKGNASMDQAALRLLRDTEALRGADRAMASAGFSTFRCMFSDANRLCAINGGTRAQLERAIHSARVDRVSPQTELLLLRRTEGLILFLLRLSKREGTEKTLKKGELAPSVCAAMIHMVAPQPQDTFCDPFAGHGAVGIARLRACGCKQLLLSDTDPAMVSHMQSQPSLRGRGVSISVKDAFAMDTWAEKASIDAIATDPPWGFFAPLPLPAQEFYSNMLAQFAWALAPGGRLCVLSANKEAFEQAQAEHPVFAFFPRVDLLVNGKKAALYPAVRK